MNPEQFKEFMPAFQIQQQQLLELLSLVPVSNVTNADKAVNHTRSKSIFSSNI